MGDVAIAGVLPPVQSPPVQPWKKDARTRTRTQDTDVTALEDLMTKMEDNSRDSLDE